MARTPGIKSITRIRKNSWTTKCLYFCILIKHFMATTTVKATLSRADTISSCDSYSDFHKRTTDPT